RDEFVEGLLARAGFETIDKDDDRRHSIVSYAGLAHRVKRQGTEQDGFPQVARTDNRTARPLPQTLDNVSEVCLTQGRVRKGGGGEFKHGSSPLITRITRMYSGRLSAL